MLFPAPNFRGPACVEDNVDMRPLYRFDDLSLDLEAFRLTRGGQAVHLEPKVLELLGYLVQHRGRLVEKAELQSAIWSDAAVSESALTRAVAQLRKALDDDAREARYVETVPTRGYRFRPEVRVEEGANGQHAAEGPGLPSDPEAGPAPAAAGSPVAPPCSSEGWRSSWSSGSPREGWRRPGAAQEPARELHRTLVSTTRASTASPPSHPTAARSPSCRIARDGSRSTCARSHPGRARRRSRATARTTSSRPGPRTAATSPTTRCGAAACG